MSWLLGNLYAESGNVSPVAGVNAPLAPPNPIGLYTNADYQHCIDLVSASVSSAGRRSPG